MMERKQDTNVLEIYTWILKITESVKFNNIGVKRSIPDLSVMSTTTMFVLPDIHIQARHFTMGSNDTLR